MDWLSFLGVTHEVIESLSPAEKGLVTALPYVFAATILLGAVYFIGKQGEEKEEEELNPWERSINEVKKQLGIK